MFIFLIVLHVIACIGLIVIVLIQTGKGAGLANVFGSGGGAQSVFGAQTGDMITRGTAILAGLFLITSISLAALSMKRSSSVMKSPRYSSRTQRGAMPSQIPPIAGQTAQDLLNLIKRTAKGVKDTVQKGVPPAAEQGKGSDTIKQTTIPVVPAAPSTGEVNDNAPLTPMPSVTPTPPAAEAQQPAAPAAAPDQQTQTQK